MKTKKSIFLGTVGLWLIALSLPLMSAAQPSSWTHGSYLYYLFYSGVNGYHASPQGLTVTASNSPAVYVAGTTMNIPWYSPNCSDCVSETDVCNYPQNGYNTTISIREAYSYGKLEGVAHALDYPLTEISGLSLNAKVFEKESSTTEQTCFSGQPSSRNVRVDRMRMNEVYKQAIVPSWSLRSGSMVVASGTGWDISLTPEQRDLLQFHDRLEVRYEYDYGIVASITLTAPVVQATTLNYHTEYTIEGGERRVVPGSRNAINATPNTPGMSVNLMSCHTRALEFEFNGQAIATNAALYIGDNTTPVPANITASTNKLFVEITDDNFYFDFPLTVRVRMNSNDYAYTITEEATGNDIETTRDITFTERPLADYNSCLAIQGTLNLNGWSSATVPAAQATLANGMYTLQPGVSNLQVTKTFGYCRSQQTVPVPVQTTPVAPQVSFPNGTSYCPNGTLAAVIDNWSSLPAGLTIKAEQADGWSKVLDEATLNFQPIAGQVRFYTENNRGCKSDRITATVGLHTITSITTQPVGQTLCAGETVSLSVVAEGTNLNYQWYHNNTPVGTNSAIYSATATTTLSGNYHVVVSGLCGEVVSRAVSVDVKETPRHPVITGDAWTCNGGQAVIEQQDMEEGVNYALIKEGVPYPINGLNYWFTEPGQTAGNIPGRSFNLPEGTYALTASNRSKLDCSVSTSFTVAARTTQFGLAVNAANRFCRQEGTTDLFDVLKGGYAALGSNTAQWTLSKDCSEQVPVIDGRYITTLELDPGFYTATLTVGNGSCDTTLCSIIEILARPENLSVTADSTVCNGLPVTYTAGYSDLSYEWYLDGAKVDGINGHQFTQSYSGNGLHNVYAVGTNANGCKNSSDTVETEALTVVSGLKFKPAAVYTTCPEKLYLSIKDSLLNRSSSSSEYDNLAYAAITDGQFKYTFEGEGLAIKNKDYLDSYNSASGTHTLYLAVKESFSKYEGHCSVRNDSMPVVINPAPPIFTVSPVSAAPADTILLCNQPELSMKVDAPSNAAYIWYNGNEYLGYGDTFTQSLQSAGFSGYKVWATGDYTCRRESENTILAERRFVDFDIRFNNTAIAYCNDAVYGMVNLFDNMSGTNKEEIRNQSNGYSYAITGGGLPVVQSGEVNTGLAVTGQIYPVAITALKNGCEHTIHADVTVHAASDSATISPATVAPLCNGEQVTLTASAQDADSFRWYRNGVLLSQTAAVLVETANASATYTVEGYNPGCGAGQMSAPVTVEVAPAPEFVLPYYHTRNRTNLAVSADVSENTTTAYITLYEDIEKTAVRESRTASIMDGGGYYYFEEFFTVARNDNYAFTVELVSDNNCRVAKEFQTTLNSVVETVTPNFAPRMMPFAAPVNNDSTITTPVETEAATLSFKATLIPTAANNGEAVRLLVQATTTGRALVRVMDVSGNIHYSQRVVLQEGHNEVDLTVARPSQGWFLVQVIYSDGTTEILKGLVQ